MREIYKGLREIFGEKGAGMGVGDPIYAPTAPCRCAGAVSAGGVHSLPHGKERTKKTELGKPSSQRFCSPAKHGRRASANAKLSPQRALPFGSPRCYALAIDISAPRKNVYQHFSSVAKMSFAIEKARREIQRFPSYFGSGGCPPSVWQKGFEPYSPFSICEGCVRPRSGIKPRYPVLEAVPNKTERLHLPNL